jgi:hypothetical protein
MRARMAWKSSAARGFGSLLRQRVCFRRGCVLHGIGANPLHFRYQLAGLAGRFRVVAWKARATCSA